MKKQLSHLLILILFPLMCISQEYIDLFSINYGKSGETSFNDLSQNTTITTFETNVTLPIVLNTKYAVITGINFGSNTLQLFPDSNYTHLYSTLFKAGINVNHSEHWKGTYILLPKVASDYINVSNEDFYFGGALVWKYKKNKNFSYSFGFYGSNEAYGFFASPIIGLYYHSPNSRFEMNFNLPSDGTINYSLTDKTQIGFDYVGRGSSFKLTTATIRSTYVENNSLEFSSFIQRSFFNNILLRLKIGFSTNQFEVYPIDQKLDLKISVLKFGDHRTQLNTDYSSSAFFKIEGIYRFDIGINKK